MFSLYLNNYKIRFCYLVVAKIRINFEIYPHLGIFFSIFFDAISIRFLRYPHSMRQLLIITLLVLLALPVVAQDRTVQNRPYTDLRKLHFGVLVGAHLQDLELVNVGPQTVTTEDGGTQTMEIACDQDTWDPAFQVGVLAELRLSETFQFRVAPAMYFGSRHITFKNYSVADERKSYTEKTQQLKSAYISCAFDLIAAAPRFNNHRPYFMIGLNPTMNLMGKDQDYLKLKRTDVFLEAGIGCDFYLPFFKLRPELKFMYGLTNSLDTSHPSTLRDDAMRPYATSVSKARSKMICLTFYFE